MGNQSQAIEEYLRSNRARQLDELNELLRIPSVSALSAHKGDIHKAADWVASNLKAAGVQEVEVMPTAGNPVVFAEWRGAKGAPTALIYGHYDVQPVDPLALWETDPFTPTERDGKLYARGASDDKGQVFMHIKAVEALLATEGELPVNIKFLIEGEEEIGSPSLAAFVQEHEARLAADLIVISDSALYAKGIPAICYGLRGLASLEVHLKGAKGDLHSGQYGGTVGNPLHVLAELVASLHDGQGKVAVKGFYDRVEAPTSEERARLQALPFDEEAFEADLGVQALVGEEGYTPIERKSIRPTLEVNGMWGGFQGEGTKTVLPSEAHAKITCRLVPDQDPGEIVSLIERHLKERCHPSVTLTVEGGAGARAWVCSPDEPALQATVPALRKAYGRDPVFIRMGGSIPVVETFASILKSPVVLMGFGLPGENLHAPNEHFHLENFDKGLRAITEYWHEVSGEKVIGTGESRPV